MISRQCLQSQVTGTPWNCFLRRESCVNKSLPLCHILPLCHTMPYYAHLCSDVARSVQQSGATCSWWSTGGWFLTKNDITTVSSVAGNWHTLKLLLASWVVRQQKLATVPHLATMPIYALTLQGVFNSLEPHAHGEAQVDDFWQKMISRQCLQSQVTGTPWNCFLRRESCVNKSLLLCHILPLCHTMPIYALTLQVLSQRWHRLLLHLRHSPSFPSVPHPGGWKEAQEAAREEIEGIGCSEVKGPHLQLLTQ